MAYGDLGSSLVAGFQAGSNVAARKQEMEAKQRLEQQKQLEARKKGLQDMVASSADYIGKIKGNVLTEEQAKVGQDTIFPLVQSALQRLQFERDQGLINDTEYTTLRNSIGMAVESPFEYQRVQQDIANKAKEQQAVGDVQVAQAVSQAEQMTPVLVSRNQQGKPSIQNFYNPQDGSQQAIDMTAAGASEKVNQLIAGGYMALSQPVVQTATMDALKSLPSSAQGKALEAMNKSQDALIRLGDIKARFDPRFLELPTRLKAGLLDTIDRLAPGDMKNWLAQNANLMTPEDQQLVSEFKSFIQTAYVTINETIRDITGAQMSIPEADRIMKQLPNPEKDGPVAFAAKLNTSIELMERDMQLATARFNYLTQRGQAPNFADQGYEAPISLQGMDIIIKARAKELGASVRQQFPNLSPEAAKEMVRARLQNEFGI